MAASFWESLPFLLLVRFSSPLLFPPLLSRVQVTPDDITRLAYEIRDMKPVVHEPSLQVKILSPKGTLPVRSSSLAAGYDLSSSIQITVPSKGQALIPLDIAVTVPE